jgi:hypothetical protein
MSFGMIGFRLLLLMFGGFLVIWRIRRGLVWITCFVDTELEDYCIVLR